MKTATIIAGVIAALVCLVLLGLQIKPGPLLPYQGGAGRVSSLPLPEDLPAPVSRFYKEVYGEEIPHIKSAVITGTAELRIQGITFPARFRFTHEAGKSYRHYIDSAFFGFPVLKVNEKYISGVSRMELPFGVSENEPKINQAANLALWAEAIWFPAIYLTDPAVSWEPVDEHTAILVVPYEDDQERLIARFDPETGFLASFEVMRYKAADSQAKTLWINYLSDWSEVDGYLIPRVGEVTWYDEGSPWAVFSVSDLVINADVKDYLRADGP